MIKSELTRIFNSFKGRVGFALIFIFPLIDVIQHIYGDVIMFGDFGTYHINHPAYAAFLSGSSMGHFTQILMFWILPLYFLVLYSDSYIEDSKTGYKTCIVSRIGRREYYKVKIGLSFFVPLILVFISLSLNLIICLCLFRKGVMFGGLEDFYMTMDEWFRYGFNHPYKYYFVYMITVSIVSGLSGIMGVCCSIIINDYLKVYPMVFGIWFIQILIPFGIGNSVQPYTEYGIGYYFSGLVIYIISIFIICCCTYIVRRKDEI